MAILTETDVSDVEGLLQNIDAEADNLIRIADRERRAIRDFDSVIMIEAAAGRQNSLERLINMEELCRSLLTGGSEEGEDMSMERMLARNFRDSGELNLLRMKAYENLNQALQVSQENRLRMLAAFNVIKDVLQSIGIGKDKNVTYGPGGSR